MSDNKLTSLEKFNITNKSANFIQTLNNGNNLQAIRKLASRTVGFVVIPTSSVIDTLAHGVFAGCKVITGVLLTPYQFFAVILHLKPINDWSLHSAVTHLTFSVQSLGNAIPLTLLVILNPNKVAEVTDRTHSKRINRLIQEKQEQLSYIDFLQSQNAHLTHLNEESIRRLSKNNHQLQQAVQTIRQHAGESRRANDTNHQLVTLLEAVREENQTLRSQLELDSEVDSSSSSYQSESESETDNRSEGGCDSENEQVIGISTDAANAAPERTHSLAAEGVARRGHIRRSNSAPNIFQLPEEIINSDNETESASSSYVSESESSSDGGWEIVGGNRRVVEMDPTPIRRNDSIPTSANPFAALGIESTGFSSDSGSELESASSSENETETSESESSSDGE